ncbi:MAG: hypothetical protein JWP69_1463 [Flaviaesturariibacter sp.]|nr:hypothetical protein [Flaviaesturariibacter sp.]
MSYKSRDAASLIFRAKHISLFLQAWYTVCPKGLHSRLKLINTMKAIFSFMAGTLVTVTAVAQSNAGTLTVKLVGAKQRTVQVDGMTYNATTQTTTGNRPQSLVTVPGLTVGQHTLTVTPAGTTAGGRRAEPVSTSFTLRSGYDLTITVSNNGAMQTSETRIRNRAAATAMTPMSTTNFNTLYSTVQRTRGNSAKASVINNALNTTGNYFTAYQVSQLLRQVTGESTRLDLAKSAYRKVTDPTAYNQVSSLLTSTAARNELSAYMSANSNGGNTVVYNNSNGTYNARNFTPMSDATYRSLYSNIQNAYYATERLTALRSAFANTNNYFTSYQAKDLIALAGDETSRLELAKAAYRSVSDPANFTVMNDLLNLQYNRDALATYVQQYNNGNVNGNSGTNTSYRTPVSTATFNTLYTAVQRQWTAQGKYDAVASAFGTAGNYYTSSQVKQLVGLVNDENGRLDLAKRSLPTVTDVDNFSQVYDLLSTPSLRSELQAYAFNYITTGNGTTGAGVGTGTNTTYRTPMTASDFETLYSGIQKQWIPGSKHSALRSTFANSSYYFTVAQVRQLLLLTTEDNRLDLAKTAYRNITDPASIASLYDVFATQASRDAMAEYVRTNQQY